MEKCDNRVKLTGIAQIEDVKEIQENVAHLAQMARKAGHNEITAIRTKGVSIMSSNK